MGRIPDGNLDEIDVWDSVVFTWGDDFLSEVVESPTWLDVAVIANGAVEEADSGHMGLEGSRTRGGVNGEGVLVYKLLMSP